MARVSNAACDVDLQLSACWWHLLHRLDRIAGQVQNYLFEQDPVGSYRRQVGRNRNVYLDNRGLRLQRDQWLYRIDHGLDL